MKKWFQKVANFLEEEDLRVDLNKFKDPEAKVISWQALQPSQGSNRKAMDLEYKNKDQLFIKIGKAMRVFFLIPMVIVLVGILELINLDPLETGSVGPGFKQIVLMVLFFLGFAGFFLWFYFEMYAQTVCMDKNQKKNY